MRKLLDGYVKGCVDAFLLWKTLSATPSMDNWVSKTVRIETHT